jgi:lipopolysaccharide export system permease protein
MKTPALDIKEGVFYDGIPNYSIKVNRKLDDVRLQDIIIYNHTDGQGNLNVTLADSGRMETFLNDTYMKLTLYRGQNYKDARSTRGISEAPVEFSRTKFEENVMVFDLSAFQLSRTPEDQWSTNRAIKRIDEIKEGLDSINFIINDLKYQNYTTAASIYPFFTRVRKLTPSQEILELKAEYDTLRKIKLEEEQSIKDSLNLIRTQDSLKNLKPQKQDSLQQVAVSSVAESPAADSLFQRKLEAKKSQVVEPEPLMAEIITTVDTTGLPVLNKKIRTEPLTDEERQVLDSIIYDRGYITNAITMALNNSRNLKNTFNIKMTQFDGHLREYRRYEIAWYQKYSQAIACFMMFLIGAPLGSIIKKGGLGLPVLISILFFILFYMLTITGEKWAKEGVTDSFFGTIFSNLCLLPFGLFFLRQARRDARLFEADFYTGLWRKMKQIFMPKKAN